jgi:hypothetical protein
MPNLLALKSSKKPIYFAICHLGVLGFGRESSISLVTTQTQVSSGGSNATHTGAKDKKRAPGRRQLGLIG